MTIHHPASPVSSCAPWCGARSSSNPKFSESIDQNPAVRGQLQPLQALYPSTRRITPTRVHERQTTGEPVSLADNLPPSPLHTCPSTRTSNGQKPYTQTQLNLLPVVVGGLHLLLSFPRSLPLARRPI
jgi:hypothetical protein